MNGKLQTPDKKISQNTGKKIVKKRKTKISIKKVSILIIILIILIILPFVSCSEDFKTTRSRALAKSEIVYKSSVFTPSEKDRRDRPYPVLDKNTGLYYFVYNKTSGSWETKLTEAIYENGFCSTGFYTSDNKLKTYITAAKKDGKWGYIKFSVDTSGKMQLEGTFENNFYIEPVYESAEPFYNGIAAVKQNSLYGFINMNGTYIIQPQYLDVRYYNEGVIPVRCKDAWYFTDTNEKVILGPYEEAESFSEGFALIKQNGMWGYIKKDGSYAVEPSFKDGWEVKNNEAWVMKNDNWIKINLK